MRFIPLRSTIATTATCLAIIKTRSAFAQEAGFKTKLRGKGGIDGSREYLSVGQDCGAKVDLWSVDPLSDTQIWTLEEHWDEIRQQWVMDVPKAGQQIASVSGRWLPIVKCQGCSGERTYEFSEGVEATESDEWAQEQSAWAKAAVTASMEVSGSTLVAEATASVSGTVSGGGSDTVTANSKEFLCTDDENPAPLLTPKS